MTGGDRSTIDERIGPWLRRGVAVSAGALTLGLALTLAGVTAGTGALYAAGLWLLMAMPAALILTSIADGLRQGDRVLAGAAAVVLVVVVLAIVSAR